MRSWNFTRLRRTHTPFAILDTLVFVLFVICMAMPSASHAAFPGANGRIAFQRNLPAGDDEIFSVESDGNDVQQLTTTPKSAQPHWSADGLKITFHWTPDGNFAQIYTMNADGSGRTNLSNNAFMDINGTYSPDGTKVLFQSLRNGNGWDIYVMNADGSSPVRLTTYSGTDDSPTWSPDGTKIAFIRHFSDGDIWIMDADGNNQNPITSDSADDGYPNWSPDGSRIAFTSINRNGDGDSEIYTLKTDGTDVQQVTQNTDFDAYPAWSPDGTQIAFTSTRDVNSEIYTMNADGSNQVNITNNPGQEDFLPDWQPMPSSIQYSFTGFFQPIDNDQPNAAKAGQSIPIKWRLTDGNGVPIADPSSFVSVTSSPTSGSCSGIPDGIETYAGSSGLQYLGDGYWQFNWKTPKSYAGQCRTMTLNLNDGGTDRTATFIFK
jgi:Tol biopolymer transport system component